MNRRNGRRWVASVAWFGLLMLWAHLAVAGPLLERLLERRQGTQHPPVAASDGADEESVEFGGNALSCREWSAQVERLAQRSRRQAPSPLPDLRDVAYGEAPAQKLDVFLPTKASAAPILVMVHGGGWCVGDKAGGQITQNKVARWVSRGFIFVSINYPMVGDGSDALAQAHHVARAVAFVQASAASWGGDPAKVILLGHSAGAHLVSLVNADAAIRKADTVAPLLGTISLDAGALDVVRQMPNVYPFLKTRYREAFGTTEAQWLAASPFHRLGRDASPWFGVCSTQRKDDPCGQARAYADKSNGLGVKARVLPEAMGHGAINRELGLDSDYTRAVEAFMASLDADVARRLGR